MAKPPNDPTPARPRNLSVDGWAVTVALFAALLVRLGLISKVPW